MPVSQFGVGLFTYKVDNKGDINDSDCEDIDYDAAKDDEQYL